jgi:hypothetical protein
MHFTVFNCDERCATMSPGERSVTSRVVKVGDMLQRDKDQEEPQPMFVDVLNRWPF